MRRIFKIDNFTKDSKSKYGLDSGGSCYIVTQPFHIEIISAYPIEVLGTPNKLKYEWNKIKLYNDDVISVTNSGCFVELKGYDGFIECRPERTSKEGEPSYDRFPIKSLEKIGKGMISSNPMSFEERKKVVITRV